MAVSTIAEIEKLAFDLPEMDRALLAAHLLKSLPPVLEDDDEGISEALRRDAELEENSGLGISLDDLDRQVQGGRV
ncbi:MAG: addiction module protein [Chthoniobacteraceae bacterium]